MTKEEFKFLKSQLPTGYLDILAKRFDCTSAIVCHALSGVSPRRTDILQAAMEMACEVIEIKKSAAELTKTIEELENK
jgi:hypothetical protein